MKTKKTLFGILILSIFYTNLFSQTSSSKQKKDNYVEITLEELNQTKIEDTSRKTRRGFVMNDYYGGGIHRNDIKIDYSNVESDYPNLRNRIYHHKWENEISTCTIKGKTKYDSAFGGTLTIIVLEIENLRSIEEYEETKSLMKIRIENIKNKLSEVKKEYDNKGKQISKGLVYHGIDESSHNTKMLVNGALENGHAYYIKNYSIKRNADSYASISYGWENKTILVSYANQSLKANIIDLEETDVIITGGYIPKVIGITGPEIVGGYHFVYIEEWDIDKNDQYTYEEIERFESELNIK